MRLIVATRNAKKGEEMLQLLAPPWEPEAPLHQLELWTLAAFPGLAEVVEDADTFAGNARKKAIETALALSEWTVADDSGLAIDALQGAPGVLSARFAGVHGDDEANNLRVLGALVDVPPERRGAAFICALCLVDPTGTVRYETQASCRGRMIEASRGSTGFGYDPLFLIREYHKTFAELGPIVKHQLSHRARAFQHLRPVLERLIREI